MYKVLIVDDEPIIRRGLTEIVQWENYGCTVCATAADGMEGIEKIQEFLPDIIFTDIRMKNMSGLAMISKASKIVPRAKFIILTAYGTFDYAQKAVELLAFRFLVKPLLPENIEKVLSEAVASLQADAQALDYTPEEKFLLENALFTDIIGSHNSDTIEERIQKYQIAQTPYYHCLSFHLKFSDHKQLKDLILQLFADTEFQINFSEKADFLYVLVRFTHPSATQSLYQKVNEILEKFEKKDITAVISSIGNDYCRINQKINECMRLETLDLDIKAKCFLTYHHLADIRCVKYIGKRNQLVKVVTSGDMGQLSRAVQTLCEALYQVDDMDLFKILCWDTIIRICKINETLSSNAVYNTASIDAMLSSTNQKGEILELIKTMSNSVTKKKYERSHNTRNVRLDMAIAYMHQHFKENITRASVAKSIYISPSYLSFIFKENLHQSFSDYLLQIRIGESEKLLKDPAIKISDVAEMVGIEDPQYFSKVFKKMNGMTPSEYRKKYT